MSIWASINHGIDIDDTEYATSDDPIRWHIDIATAAPWQNGVRFSIWDRVRSAKEMRQLVMSVDQARQLQAMLQLAIDYIEAA